jgi:Flp pilus assembly protein TadG
MLTQRPFAKLRCAAKGERGAVLVVTVTVMLVLLVTAAYAIDTAIWFVHGRHLQTQADAAALAAARDFTCTPGTADVGADAQIANTVHTYDGTGLATPPVSRPFNPQVSVQPVAAITYSASDHNLFSLINQPNFIDPTAPSDTAPSGTAWSGSPCKDTAINVKMTETNLRSFFPFINPSYISKEAQVSIQGLGAITGTLPLALPSQAPSSIHATLIDEGNGNAVVGGGRVALNNPSGDGVNWSAPYGSVALSTTNVKGPLGLRIDIGGGSTCGTQLGCYDSSGSNNGIVYSRVWLAGTAPGTVVGTGSPAGPEAGDATLTQGSAPSCPLTGAAFSNFVSGSAPCNVKLSTTVYFAPGATCGGTPATTTVGLTLSVNGTTPNMTCTGATTQTTPPCGANPCVATTWTSANVPLGGDNPDGAVPFTLNWSQNYGLQPTGAGGGGNGQQNGQCGDGVGNHPNPCTGQFGTVQRAFDGAYDNTTSNTSRSGPIIGATLTDSADSQLEDPQPRHVRGRSWLDTHHPGQPCDTTHW